MKVEVHTIDVAEKSSMADAIAGILAKAIAQKIKHRMQAKEDSECHDEEHHKKLVDIMNVPDERCDEIFTQLRDWCKEKGEYHSVDLFAFAKTIIKDPSEEFYTGVACGYITAETQDR